MAVKSQMPGSHARMVQDLARNQHALARIKGVRDDRVTFLYQFRQAADRRIERMLFRYPIRCRVRSVKYRFATWYQFS